MSKVGKSETLMNQTGLVLSDYRKRSGTPKHIFMIDISKHWVNIFLLIGVSGRNLNFIC